MRQRPHVIATRVTELERTTLQAVARLDRSSLAKTVRELALQGASERIRNLEPPEDEQK